MMMKKRVLILVCFLMVLSGIGIVNAETLTGSLGGSLWNSTNYHASHVGAGSGLVRALYIQDIEQSIGLVAVSNWQTGSFDVGAPAGATTPVTIYLGYSADNLSHSSQVIGTGYFGYQRLFTGSPPVETTGYAWISIPSNTWNVTGLTGDKYLILDYPTNALYNFSISGTGDEQLSGLPSFCFWTGAQLIRGEGWYLANYEDAAYADYSLTKPSGIGIQGNVTKTVSGSSWSSRIFITDTSNIIITSDNLFNSNDFFVSTNATQIKISMLSVKGTWYNTSTLFSSGTGTPTPTVTPTTAPTIAPGYIRTTVHLLDQNGHHIHGGNIDIRDVEGSSWTNSTHDADGISYIDTLPYHTINIYGSFDIFANEFLPNALLGQETGFEGGYSYYVVLFPYESAAGDGQTSLYVEVKDASTHSFIPYAVVQASVTGGSTYTQSTGAGGIATFLVPNQTVVRLAASADGYEGGTSIINSGTGTSYTTSIDLSRRIVTITPTSTIPPGGVTPVITVDPNDPSVTGSTAAKGQEMLNWLAMHGMDLVQLCFLVTILGLLGIKFGK